MEAFVKYNYFHMEQRPRFILRTRSRPKALHYNEGQDLLRLPYGAAQDAEDQAPGT